MSCNIMYVILCKHSNLVIFVNLIQLYVICNWIMDKQLRHKVRLVCTVILFNKSDNIDQQSAIRNS